MWVVELPLRVPVSKKQDFILNLNIYRNAHPMVLNKAKIVFADMVRGKIKHIPWMPRCELIFTLFPGDARLVDTSNVCSIQDKFFNDMFVEAGKLDDDNYTIVLSSRYNFGGIDRLNPRVEVTIIPIEKEEIMQITLVQNEIEQAIKDFVRSQINIKEGMEIIIDLKATRGADGATANIDIVPATATATPVAVKPVVRAVVKEAVVQPRQEAQVEEPPADAQAADETVPEAAVSNDPVADEIAEPAPAAPAKSLFSKLTKPVNS